MGIHSTFFGPIKYAILPQHLEARRSARRHRPGRSRDLYRDPRSGRSWPGILRATPQIAAAATVAIAVLGLLAGRQVPPAPPAAERIPFNWHIIHASIELVSATLHIRRLFLAILSISFFWTIGAVLIIIFPPLVKNVLGADEQVASLFIAIFSIGIAIGSVADQSLAQEPSVGPVCPRVGHRDGRIRAAAALRRSGLGQERSWADDSRQFRTAPMAALMIVALLGVAITGGMFVVPLYAFLTTTVPKSETARTVAANNIVNSGAMVVGALSLCGLAASGSVPSANCCWWRRCAWCPPGSVGSSTSPATDRLSDQDGDEQKSGEECRGEQPDVAPRCSPPRAQAFSSSPNRRARPKRIGCGSKDRPEDLHGELLTSH